MKEESSGGETETGRLKMRWETQSKTNGDNWSLLKNDQLACQPILKMHYIHKRLFGKPTIFYLLFLSAYRLPLHLHIYMRTISDSWKLMHKISHIAPQILSLFPSISQAQTPSFLQLQHVLSTISSWRSPVQDVFHFVLYDLPHVSADWPASPFFSCIFLPFPAPDLLLVNYYLLLSPFFRYFLLFWIIMLQLFCSPFPLIKVREVSGQLKAVGSVECIS